MASRIRRSSAAIVCVLLLTTPGIARADVVLDWNAIAVRVMTQPPSQNPFFQARYMSIVQLAVFDAVNAVTGRYESYTDAVNPTPGASAPAAAVQAAYRVLLNYFPSASALLDAERTNSLAGIPDGPAKAAGLVVGETAAQALIAARLNDGAGNVLPYLPTSTDPGEWQLTPTPPGATPCTAGLFKHWATLKPFAIADPTPFIPPSPPSLTSNRYAKDLNEVKAVGDVTSSERPADRADVARLYAGMSPTQVVNSALQQLATARGDSLSENARALALVNVAINDSFIVSFATKYKYTLWRPVTAIRNADVDGNRKTEADTGFTPFITTPCFPSYPSNHASGTNGGLETLRRLYGAAGHDIAITSPTLGITILYSSLKQIADDVDDARIFGGIHFRFDQEAGVDIGREVAKDVYKTTLTRNRGR